MHSELEDLLSKKIVVVFGGDSPEADVSLMSCETVYDALKTYGYKNVVKLDLGDTKDFVKSIKDLKVDCVFNVAHGDFGEDGRMQALLDYLKVPYTHSDMYASAVTYDKHITKRFLSSYGVKTADFIHVDKHGVSKDILDVLMDGKLSKKIVIKPDRAGSTFGVSIIDLEGHADEVSMNLINAFNKAFLYGGSGVLVERFLKGYELTVPVLEGKSLPAINVVSPAGKDLYDYDAKYVSNETQYFFDLPSGIDKDIINKMYSESELIYDTLQCCGVIRVDYIYSEGEIYLLEVNTVPGMTSHSLVPQSANKAGIPTDRLCNRLIELAFMKYKTK